VTGAAPATAWGTDQGRPTLIYLFLLSLLLPLLFAVGNIQLTPHRVLLIVLFFPLIARLFSGAIGKPNTIDYLILFSGLWLILAYMTVHLRRGADPIQGLEFSVSYFLEYIGGYLVGRIAVRSAEDLRRVAKFMFFAVLVLLPLAAIESFTYRAFLIEILGKSVVVDTRFGLKRAQVVFSHPILFGTFVSASLGLLWYVLLPRANGLIKGLYSLVILGGTFFSLSVGALLAFFAQAGFIAYNIIFRTVANRWTLFAIGAIVAYIVVDIISNTSPFAVLARYVALNPAAAYNRILIFEHGMDNIVARPIFGFGSGGWDRPFWMSPSIDNFWLLFAMQFGIPSFLGLVGGVFLLIRRISRKALADPYDRLCRAGYLISIGGIVIAGGTVHYWQAMLSFVMFMFGAGVWLLHRPEPAAVPDLEANSSEQGEAGAASEKNGRKPFVPYGRSTS